MTRAQAKKSDKVHPLKVKEAMSSVDKSTIENLQKKDATLKKCFDCIGKPIRTTPGRHQILSFL